MAELAEKHWRDLAELPASCMGGSLPVAVSDSVCLYSTLWPAVEARLLSRKCQLLTRRTNRKKECWGLRRKSPNLFHREDLPWFHLASSFCKIDGKLDIISILLSLVSCVLLLFYYYLHFFHSFIYFLLFLVFRSDGHSLYI